MNEDYGRAPVERQIRPFEHWHCPNECEKPQPFTRNGKKLCGRCWFTAGIESEMIPCTPDICDDG